MLIQNQQTIANSFNNYFSTVAEKLMETNHIDKMNQIQNGKTLHHIQGGAEPTDTFYI